VKFFLDYDVPSDVAWLLRREGHSVALLHDSLPRTTADPAVLEHATRNGMVLITCNRKDFLALAQTRVHRGVIILIRRKTRHAELAKLLSLVRRAGEEGLDGNLNFA